VNVCASSCQTVEPQLNGPASFAAGESNASVVPKLTPSAPSPASPTVRTEKSAWLRNDFDPDRLAAACSCTSCERRVRLLGEVLQ
jgi:hypothetical protein